jgi:predicted HicB family RNase H-like nuclease
MSGLTYELAYKGYMADIRYSAYDGGLIGTIAGIEDHVVFQGGTAKEIRQAFEKAVDDYLDFRAQLEKEPPDPDSELLVVGLPAGTQERMAAEAESLGRSFESILDEILENVDPDRARLEKEPRDLDSDLFVVRRPAGSKERRAAEAESFRRSFEGMVREILENEDPDRKPPHKAP